MAAEQLTLLDLGTETEPSRAPKRPPRHPRRPAERVSALVESRAEPAPVAVVEDGTLSVVHRYPEALAFLREHGPDAVAVLHVLVIKAEAIDGRLVVRASTRGVAGRLGFLSKDTAHRRLRQLRRAGVVEALPATGPTDPPSYVLNLDGTGIAVTRHDPFR